LMKLKTNWRQNQKQKINRLIIQKWQSIESSIKDYDTMTRKRMRKGMRTRTGTKTRTKTMIDRIWRRRNDKTTKLHKWQKLLRTAGQTKIMINCIAETKAMNL
jgi:hypothetical protein